MTQQLTLITGNEGKAREFAALFGAPIDFQKVPLTEVQALRVEDVAASKAKEAFERLRRPVLVDDTGFSVHAWNGLPGALIVWFLDTVGNSGILQMASTLTDRRVSVTTALGYADEYGARVFTGTVHGVLADSERGINGFGYDSIFVPAGSDKTFAEMTADKKNEVSMRRLAVEQMKRDLRL
jgi:XTP/dITP diphosphohydrolase